MALNCSLSTCSEDGIIRQCVERSILDNRTFFCDCSPVLGWIGDECDEVSSTLIFKRAYLLIALLWSIRNVIILGEFTYNSNVIFTKGINGYARVSFLCINSWVYTLILLLSVSLTIEESFVSTNFQELRMKDYALVGTHTTKLSFQLLCFPFFLSLVATLQGSLTFFLILKRVGKIVSGGFVEQERFFIYLDMFMTPVSVVIFPLLIFSDKLKIAFIYLIIFACISYPTHIYVVIRFLTVLKSQLRPPSKSNSLDPLRASYESIKFVAKVFVPLYITNAVFGCLFFYFALEDLEEVVQRKFYLSILFRGLFTMTLLLWETFTIWYMKQTKLNIARVT